MNPHRIAIILLLFTATIWGATFVVVKEGLSSISPETLIVWRFALASITLLIPGYLLGQLDRRTIRAGVILGVFLFVGYWLQTRGLLTTTPLRSAFLTALTVIFVPFFDRIIHGVRAGFLAVGASALALTGTFVLVGGVDATFSLGDGLTILCSISFAVYVVLASRLSRESGAIGLAAVQIVTVTVLSLPLAISVPSGRMDRAGLVAILVTALLATSAAFFCMMWAQARTTALEAAIILSLEPVAATATSAIVGNEPLTRAAIIGGALIFIATIISQIRHPIDPGLSD